jgi:hypothetical protein
MGGWNLGWLGLAPKKWNKAASNFLTGTPEKRENVSTLRPEQEPGFQDLQNAAQGNYGNGAFGKAGNYYNNLLSDNSADYNAFAAPALRQYSQDIMPGISEQFAGMGSGGLSSSGFMNAQNQGAVDLAERLGSIRANLRQSGAQGLQNIGQLGLGNYSQNMVTEPGSEGLLSTAAPAIGTAIGSFAGPAGAAAGNAAGNWLGSKFGGNQVGANSSPYGNLAAQSPKIAASPQIRR